MQRVQVSAVAPYAEGSSICYNVYAPREERGREEKTGGKGSEGRREE